MLKLEGNQFLTKNLSLLVETSFFFFLPEEAVFPCRRKVFFNECFIPGSGNGFSGLQIIFYIFSETPAGENLFFCLVEQIFERILHFGYWRRVFLSNGDRYFIRKIFSTSGNRQKSKPIFKDRTYPGLWKLIF